MNGAAPPAGPSDMKMEIVLVDCVVHTYRNALNEKDGLFIRFSKMGFWFTGKWGMLFKKGGLIDTGMHSFEQENLTAHDPITARVIQ